MLSWPAWHPTHGFDQLARYVVPKSVRGRNLSPGGWQSSGDDRTTQAGVSRRIFETLASRSIDYALEPYYYDIGQIIRDPKSLLDDQWGTCLDLAVTYSAMCLESHVYPLLAICPHHAFVLLALDHATDHKDSTIALPSCEPKKAGVYFTKSPSELISLLDEGGFIAVDCVDVTATNQATFDAAAHDGREQLRKASEVYVVDVPFLHRQDRTKPFPDGVGRPGIRRYPASGVFNADLSPSQQDVLNELAQSDGTVILYGGSGIGKSTVARALVDASVTGAAWFLDASSSEALRNSLADAERSERNNVTTGLEETDRSGYAAAGLQRLRASETPWTVVLDNADAEPGAIARYQPTAGRNCLVLITTTNPDWCDVPGVRLLPIKPLSEEHVSSQVGAALAPLVAGRWLLLEAFKHLHVPAEAILKHQPAAGSVSDELIGPAAFWGTICTEVGLSSREIDAARLAAYLPPDHIPIDSIERLVGVGHGGLDRLVDHHVLSNKAHTQTARMHRLFSTAVRMEADQNEDTTNVLTILNDPSTRQVLDQHATPGELRNLIKIAERHDENSEAGIRAARPLHALANILELRGAVRESADVYRRVLRHVKGPTDAERLMLADALHGMARYINQTYKKQAESSIREARDQAREAQKLRGSVEGDDLAARHLALEGILTQHLAHFASSEEDEIRELKSAEKSIKEAHERRMRLLPPDSAELARSRFNLSGVSVSLAKKLPQRRREYLDQAENVYQDVAQLRKKIYVAEPHPHIAACVYGEGVVNFERARLLPSNTMQRAAWLRTATDRAAEALRQRTQLAGPDESDDTRKSSDLLGKIVLARAASPMQLFPAYSKRLQGWEEELTVGGFTASPTRRLRSGDDLRSWIDDWIRSPALTALVDEFGGPSHDSDLAAYLAALDEFSTVWDYRGGKERNLVDMPNFRPAVAELINTAATALGLNGAPTTPTGHYDHVLILGGLVRACVTRPLFSANLLAEGTITAGHVTGLGGHRPLRGDEVPLAEKLFTQAVTDEFAAMDLGMRDAFSLGEPDRVSGESSDTPGESWTVHEYDATPTPVTVVAAPATKPGKRANTVDTYKWLTGQGRSIRQGQRALVVTTHIYAYQGIDAIRTLGLPHDVDVEWVGMRPADVRRDLNQEFQPHNYLQEIRSMIRSLHNLYAEIT